MDDVEYRAVREARTPKRCSCWMCSKQRKNHGPTFQELKLEDIKELINEQD